MTYCKFPIRGQLFDRHWEEIKGLMAEQIKASQGEENPLFQLIRQEGVKRELPLVVTTVKAFAEGKVRIDKSKVVDNSGKSSRLIL